MSKTIWKLLLILVFVTIENLLIGQNLFGDRAQKINCIYPKEANFEMGGQLIDITHPPFNAIGDGKTDNTEAFIRLYDFLYYNINSKWDWDSYKAGSKGFIKAFPANKDASYVVYIPDGEYLVSNTIIYSYPIELWNNTSEQLFWIRFVGQSREKTIIKLKDNCRGFEENAQKPVLSFGKSTFNNIASINSCRNLTINTGKGNPGAIGLDFSGANNTGIHNVAIISGDGQGKIGLYFQRPPSMGYHYDLFIDGFDYGISIEPYHATHHSFEYVSLVNQRKAGIKINNSTCSLRKIYSKNNVPAILTTGAGSHSILLNSVFENTNSGKAAIQIDEGYLFARDIRNSGYPISVLKKNKVDHKGDINEYLSTLPIPRSGKKSMNMEIIESPVAKWNTDLTQWAVVENYGAVGNGISDDSDAIQRAMNSGKPIVFFPNRRYLISKTVKIPSSVKQIMGLYSIMETKNKYRNPLFEIMEETTNDLFVDDIEILGGGFGFVQTKPRTVVFNHVFTQGYLYKKLTSDHLTLFVNNCNGFGKPVSVLENVTVYCRFINTEFKRGSNFIAGKGAKLWVLGYKVEGAHCNFEARDGAMIEVLGGVANQYTQGRWVAQSPIIRNKDAYISYIGCTNGTPDGLNAFDIFVEEIQKGDTIRIKTNTLPERTGRKRNWVIPLYSKKLF